MNKLILYVFLLLIPATAIASPVGTIQFGDQDFHHAWENNENIITQEYIPVGDALEQWRKIVVYRIYPGTDNLDEVINQYFSQVEPAQPPTIYKANDDDNDQIFVFMIADPERVYIEYVIHRFVMIDGEVRSYQFAARAIQDETNDLREEIVQNKEIWIDAVANMTDTTFTGE